MTEIIIDLNCEQVFTDKDKNDILKSIKDSDGTCNKCHVGIFNDNDATEVKGEIKMMDEFKGIEMSKAEKTYWGWMISFMVGVPYFAYIMADTHIFIIFLCGMGAMALMTNIMESTLAVMKEYGGTHND